MAEQVIIPAGLEKKERYETLMPQLQALVEGESDWLACTGNIVAALHHGMKFFWTGIYRVSNQELVLGPFQGPVACLRIGHGKGVCGSAWKENRTLVVPDVDKFPGHIACNSLSRSEIVVPIRRKGEVVGVLDVDSTELATFDDIDAHYLERIAELIAHYL